MEEFYNKMVNFIKQENEKLKNELRNEFKKEITELREQMLVLEHDLGKKIDATYEFVCLQSELLEDRFEEIRSLDRRVQRNEMRILDHENRICNLEKIKN